MQEQLHGRCRRPSGDAGAATQQGRPASGLKQRSNQAELDVCPPPSLFLSLARTRGKSLKRKILRGKSSIGRVDSRPFAFGADAQSIPAGLQ